MGVILSYLCLPWFRALFGRQPDTHNKTAVGLGRHRQQEDLARSKATAEAMNAGHMQEDPLDGVARQALHGPLTTHGDKPTASCPTPTHRRGEFQSEFIRI
jgi:hypothetical protein